MSFTLQWTRDGTAIPGATSTTYSIQPADQGHTLAFRVVAANASGSTTASSGGVTVPAGPPGPTPTPPAGSVAINSSTELWNTLNAGVVASGGKTYLLAAIDFGTFYTPACDFTANPIVIQGQPGTSFTALGGAQKGVTWKDFNVSGGVGIGTDCAYLTFQNVTAHTGAPEGSPVGQGFGIRNADHITIIGAADSSAPDILGCGNGLAVIDSTNVTLRDLTMANIGVDGIIFSNADNLTIDGVVGYNFHSDIAGGDHPDFIQGFGGNTGVTITNCGWERGTGTEAQGYFFEDTSNLTVANCWLYGGLYNSIAVARGSTALFDNNYVVGFADYGSDIIVRGAYVNATVSHNFTGAVNNYAADGVNPGFSPAVGPGSNTIIGSVTAGDYSGLDAWLATHPTARRRP